MTPAPNAQPAHQSTSSAPAFGPPRTMLRARRHSVRAEPAGRRRAHPIEPDKDIAQPNAGNWLTVGKQAACKPAASQANVHLTDGANHRRMSHLTSVKASLWSGGRLTRRGRRLTRAAIARVGGDAGARPTR